MMENDKEMSRDEKGTQEIAEKETVISQLETENETEQESHAGEEPDYANYSKEQLLGELKDQYKKGDYIKSDPLIQELKSAYEEVFEKEKEEALQSYISDGGDVDGFEYRKSELDQEFFRILNEFKGKRALLVKELEQSKDKNLSAKNQILDKLRDLVDGEETTDSIVTIKQIQDEWKAIGPVPSNQNKNIWASYNALMDRF